MKLQFATRCKPGAVHNEDLFGFKEDTFWLLDGATSTDGPPLDRNAYWLVHEMDLVLTELWTRDQNLVDLACQACAKVAERWPTSSLDRPVAAMALWRIRDGVLEAAITGNVTLLAYVGTRAYEMTDHRVLPAHEGASAALIKALADGVLFESEEFKALRRAMKGQEAAALDLRANSWLVSPSQRSVEDFVTFVGPFEDNDLLIAATDGFMELRRYIDHVDLMEFRKYVESATVNRSMDLLRTYEKHPNSGLLFPRTKRHDDATVALISYP